ncbi:MAG: hypothetical protein R3F34_09155, partial [Planctomycetota bacterium]
TSTFLAAVLATVAATQGGATSPVPQEQEAVDYGTMALPGQPPQATVVQTWSTGYLVEVVFFDTPSGFVEKTLVYVPLDSIALGPRPMLVVFHQYGKNHFDAFDNTSLIEECRQRGWFCVAPLGAAKKTYASVASQLNVEHVVDCAANVFWPWVDRRRVYGIGFSMGAGDCATFAARHQDPYHPIFAGLVLHTGNHDKTWVWDTEPAVQDILDFWFGGSPTQFPFEYAQASTVKLNPTTGAFVSGLHQGRNLEYIATRTFYAQDDSLPFLQTSALGLHDYLSVFSGVASLDVSTDDHSALPNTHSWDTLDQKDALDFLSSKVLTMPPTGHQVMDRSGQAWWFDVHQSATGAFSTFTWVVNRTTNVVAFRDTKNVEWASLPYHLVGFAPGPLTIYTKSVDGSDDEFRLDGFAAAPSSVVVNGVAALAGVDYEYDAAIKRLTIHGGPVLDKWVVTPWIPPAPPAAERAVPRRAPTRRHVRVVSVGGRGDARSPGRCGPRTVRSSRRCRDRCVANASSPEVLARGPRHVLPRMRAPTASMGTALPRAKLRPE